MSAKINIIEGASCKELNGRLVELVRMAHVFGLTAGTNTVALALSDAAMPLAGSVHPDNSALFLVERNVLHATSQTECRVQLVYRRFGVVSGGISTATIGGGTGLRQVEIDFVGTTQLKVSFGGNDVPCRVVALRPQSTLRFSRTEQTNSPGAISKLYTGKLNSSSWQGGNPGTWMCMGITFELAVESSPLNTYMMNYEFQYDENEWHPVGVAIDPSTGIPFIGVNSATGSAKFANVYTGLNFNTLFA